jgi:hypothetical protein
VTAAPPDDAAAGADGHYPRNHRGDPGGGDGGVGGRVDTAEPDERRDPSAVRVSLPGSYSPDSADPVRAGCPTLGNRRCGASPDAAGVPAVRAVRGGWGPLMRSHTQRLTARGVSRNRGRPAGGVPPIGPDPAPGRSPSVRVWGLQTCAPCEAGGSGSGRFRPYETNAVNPISSNCSPPPRLFLLRLQR